MSKRSRIQELRDQGATGREIAARMGVSATTIWLYLTAPKPREISPPPEKFMSKETIFKRQIYLMSNGVFARILEAPEFLEFVTVSLHDSALDDVVLLDGSNTEEFTRSQVKCWRLWDSVNCKAF